jgi:precorrin-2 dehydrogenase/sirohydrochlorin ferrochelatase
VGLRKVDGLLAAGARVVVVAPNAEASIAARARDGGLEWRRRAFEPDDVLGSLLVFACTPDSDVNEAVCQAAGRAGALTNRADGGPSYFAGMATVTRGDMIIAISSASGSPAFSAWMKGQVEQAFGAEYGELLAIAASLRDQVKARFPPAERSRAWRRALRSNALHYLRRGDAGAARQALREALSLDPE